MGRRIPPPLAVLPKHLLPKVLGGDVGEDLELDQENAGLTANKKNNLSTFKKIKNKVLKMIIRGTYNSAGNTVYIFDIIKSFPGVLWERAFGPMKLSQRNTLTAGFELNRGVHGRSNK